MDIEAFMLCDAATDNGGKLNILGSFDSIMARTVPVVHPQCSIAVRIRFSRIEEGEHKLKIGLVDADGQPVVPDLDAGVNVRFNTQESSLAVNLIMNLQRIQFKAAGDYSVNLSADGKFERSIPLTVRLKPQQQQQQQDSNWSSQ